MRQAVRVKAKETARYGGHGKDTQVAMGSSLLLTHLLRNWRDITVDRPTDLTSLF
ncbi:MAG: hypothetical protein ACE5JQ_16530 [Candidatus Methylomirabilales bacterium]